jgi:pentatricopeptide repeat protein
VDGAVAVLQLSIMYARAGVSEYSFFLVLKCCAAGRRMSLAEPLLKQMRELGVPRSGFIYSCLFKGYGRQRWRERVEATAREMMAEVCHALQ